MRCDRQNLEGLGGARPNGARRSGAGARHGESRRGASGPAVPTRVAAPAPRAGQALREPGPRPSALGARPLTAGAPRPARLRRPVYGLRPLARPALSGRRPPATSVPRVWVRAPWRPGSWLRRRARREPAPLLEPVHRHGDGPRPGARRLPRRAGGRRVRFATDSDCPRRQPGSDDRRPMARGRGVDRQVRTGSRMLARSEAGEAAPRRPGARRGRGDAWSPPPPSWSGHG